MAVVSPISFWVSVLDSRERVALANWLLIWVVLANLGFVAPYIVGSPSRVSEIFLFGVLGFISRNRSILVQAIAFATGLAYSVVMFISSLFNLPVHEIADSIRFLEDWQFFSSGQYLAFGLAFLGIFVVACRTMRRPSNFVGGRAALLACAVVALVALADVLMSYGALGHYNRFQIGNPPFSSAVSKSNFLSAQSSSPRHLLIVMVESLGTPRDNAELQRLIFARYRDPAVRSRFDVSNGTTTFYGSTTSGEVRELCGRWGNYHELVDRRDDECLPATLARQGFETSAYHSFSSDFFDRSAWYPNIGFQHQFFRSDLIEAGAETCGGVFPGACDRDVPRQLAQRLKAADKPQFIYWLTVNSHLPVPYGGNLDADDCARLSAKLAAEFPMICRQAAIWDAIDEALVKEMTAPDFPATDILIVGDHMPPYFRRKSRMQFAADRVPWLLLRWRTQ